MLFGEVSVCQSSLQGSSSAFLFPLLLNSLTDNIEWDSLSINPMAMFAMGWELVVAHRSLD